MKHRLRTARTVECLYCETELKPFRGLFDEDFCCREHRDKYFSSFRKALNRLPGLDIPLAVPTPVSLAMGETCEPAFFANSPKVPAGTVEPSYTELLAATEELVEQVTPPVEIPAETVELPVPLAAIAAEEPVTGLVSDVVYKETPADPPAADFLHLAVAAMAGAQSARNTSLDTLPASYAIELPGGDMTWAVALEMEERPAELLEPSQAAAATAFLPMPAPLELSAENPAITQTVAMLPEAALPEAADPAAHSQYLGACGHNSLWNYTDPLTPAPVPLTVAAFCPQADGAAWLPTAEFAELTLAPLPLASSPVPVPDIQLVHAFCAPVFTPSSETMLGGDECQQDERDAHGETPAADSPAPPEIAAALVMNSMPVDRPALLPTCAAEMMPPALALSSARSSAPAPLSLASTIEGQPHLAPELMADIPQSPAANQAAEPHAHAPLRHLFGSSVRIKNWRLRITFAKPA